MGASSNDENDADEEDCNGSIEMASGVSVQGSVRNFQRQPIYLISKYKDVDSRDDRVAVATLLPSGLHEQSAGITLEIDDERS